MINTILKSIAKLAIGLVAIAMMLLLLAIFFVNGVFYAL